MEAQQILATNIRQNGPNTSQTDVVAAMQKFKLQNKL